MKKRKNNYKNSVVFLTLLIVVISIFCRVVKVQAEDTANVRVATIKEIHQTTEQKLASVSAENQALKDKLEASAKIETPDKVKEVSLFYIRKYFGAEADTVVRVMNCESHLNNLVTHVNKDGSKDMGLYQIHDEPTHRKNFLKMYGVPLEVGAYDFDLASRYAKFLWDRSPRNWVCYSLI